MSTPPVYSPAHASYSSPEQPARLSFAKACPIITTTFPYSTPPAPSDVPTAVASLLGLTKQLQDILRFWSTRQATASQVSDAYVLVGMQFNATVNAFERHHVDMSDLLTIPTELRRILENCLGGSQSSRTLERFNPAIRGLVYRLLKGLQSKQAPYRKAVESERESARFWDLTPIEEALPAYSRER